MPDSKITALTALTTADPAVDMFPVVDVSDTTMAASGTTKRISINNILACSPAATLASLNVTGSSIPANGLYLPTTNTLEFAANSLAQYRIAPLGVFSWYDGAGGTRMTLNATGLGVGDSPTSNTRLTVAAASRLTDTTGQAYIHSTDAQAQDIGAQLTLGGLYNASAHYAFGGIAGRKENSTSGNVAGYLDLLTTTSAGALTSRMRIDSTGNVGIGVQPSARFHSKAGAVTQGGIIETTGANALLSFADAGTSSYTRVQIGSSGNNLAAFINSVQAMTLDASGNLLVGVTSTTTPGVGNTTAGGSLNANGAAFFSNASSQALYLNTNVDGQIVSIRRSNVAVGSISVTTTGTTFNSLSDYRLKEAVAPLSGGLARISALKPSVYKWKADGSNGEGFLAHELAEIVPLAVTGEKDAVNEDGSIKAQGVDLSKVVPVLVAAIQELTAEVNALKNA